MTTSLLAIDISGHQTTTPSLAGLGSVFVKATEGTGFIDPMYATHSAHVLSHGLHLASYHFAISTADINTQAAWYLAHTSGAQALVIDNEDRYAVINGIRKLVSPKMTRTDTTRLIAAVKARDTHHREVGLYMNHYDYVSGGYAACGQGFAWIARWGSTPPSVHWDVWQYSSTPQGTLDLDRFASQAAFARIFSVTPPAPATHTVHIAHNAIVRVYDQFGGGGCILANKDGSYGKDTRWWRAASQGPCGAPVHRKTCDGKSTATTVLKTSGAFAGKHIRIHPPEVTVS